MSYRIKFTIPGLPRTMNSRGHWRTGHRASQKWIADVARAVGYQKPPRPLFHAKLELTRCSSVPMDHDNLVSGFKPIIDGLVRCGVLADDKWENIGFPVYHWEKSSPKDGKIIVLVEESKIDSEGEPK